MLVSNNYLRDPSVFSDCLPTQIALPNSPAESWDLHETITDFLMRFTKNVKDHTEKIEKDFDT